MRNNLKELKNKYNLEQVELEFENIRNVFILYNNSVTLQFFKKDDESFCRTIFNIAYDKVDEIGEKIY